MWSMHSWILNIRNPLHDRLHVALNTVDPTKFDKKITLLSFIIDPSTHPLEGLGYWDDRAEDRRRNAFIFAP